MDTDQDLKDAQYLSQQYPELDYWRKCINDKDLRGFVTDDENDDEDGNGSDVNRDTIASHNLSNLLEILEKSDDAIEKVDESDKEWDEMCQILSQKTNESRAERAESPELLCSDDDDQIDEILGEKENLLGRLLIFDGLSYRMKLIKINWDQNNPLNGRA